MAKLFRRYGVGARVYDVVSGERQVYRAGRGSGIGMLHLRTGDVVVDLGCGTGLNFPLLQAAVGLGGLVIGIDRSLDMLTVASRRIVRRGWSNVRLLQADAARLESARVRELIAAETGRDGADALVATYALSVIAEREEAWRRACDLLRPNARVAIVDMQPPVGRWRFAAPLARAACALGGADIEAQPWRMLEPDAEPGTLTRRELRGGHIVAVAGALPAAD